MFYKWQEREDSKLKIAKEKRLIEFLVFILNKFYGFDSMPNTFSFYGVFHTENQNILNRMKAEIAVDEKVPVAFRYDFIKHCRVDIDALTALLPVAADLSEEHFKSWARIVYYIKKSSMLDLESQDDFAKFDSNIIKLLDYIRRFDKASFGNKTYCGAV